MTITEYCRNKRYNKKQYENLKFNINEIVKEIKKYNKETKGVYKPISEIIRTDDHSETILMLIINELKKHGFEFIENYTYYRV
jgi:predicted Zn-ribbon and HTH transcriptional regulator